MELNEFQLSLIAAGVAAVLLVWIYNLLQERKHRKAAEKVFQSSHPDVLLGGEEGVETPAPAEAADGEWERKEPQFEVPAETGERVEPVITELEDVTIRLITPSDPEPPQAAAEPQPPKRDIPVIEAPEMDQVTEPGFAAVPPPVIPSQPLAQAPVRPARQTVSVRDDSSPDESLSDSVVEVSVAVSFDQPQMLDAFWEPLRQVPARAAAHMRCIGSRQGRWREIQGHDGQAYDEVHLLLQLADRQGPMTEVEVVPFVQAVEAAAAQVGGRVAVPPVPEVLAHARSLDEFCAGVDIQMAVHVVSRTGGEFAGSKLRGLLEAAGFKLKQDGLFHLADDTGNTLLTLSNFGAKPFAADQLKTLLTHGVTFWLDVPRVANGPQVFDRLLNSAKHLADAVDGVLVDDQRRPLGEAVLANIRAKIGEVQKSMGQNQIPAGGRRALRLFR